MSLIEHLKDLAFVVNPFNIFRYFDNKSIEKKWERIEWPERYIIDHRTVQAISDRLDYELCLDDTLKALRLG